MIYPKHMFFSLMSRKYIPPTSFELTEDECKSVRTIDDAKDLIHQAAIRGSMRVDMSFMNGASFGYNENVGFSLQKGNANNYSSMIIFRLKDIYNQYLPLPTKIICSWQYTTSYMCSAGVAGMTNKNTRYNLININDSHNYTGNTSSIRSFLYKDNMSKTITGWAVNSNTTIELYGEFDLKTENTSCFVDDEHKTFIDYFSCLTYAEYSALPAYIKYMKIDFM